MRDASPPPAPPQQPVVSDDPENLLPAPLLPGQVEALETVGICMLVEWLAPPGAEEPQQLRAFWPDACRQRRPCRRRTRRSSTTSCFGCSRRVCCGNTCVEINQMSWLGRAWRGTDRHAIEIWRTTRRFHDAACTLLNAPCRIGVHVRTSAFELSSAPASDAAELPAPPPVLSPWWRRKSTTTRRCGTSTSRSRGAGCCRTRAAGARRARQRHGARVSRGAWALICTCLAHQYEACVSELHGVVGIIPRRRRDSLSCWRSTRPS